MQEFTKHRDSSTEDELWLTEHEPVFTLGQAARPEHLIFPGDIPVVQSDRGGQVTYHGPGQVVAYALFDLLRMRLTVHDFVRKIEESIIKLLQDFSIHAERWRGQPGVYVSDAKIGALGIRVRRGCSYHGLALNVDMDLSPFERINPCGMRNLRVTQIQDLAKVEDVDEVGRALAEHVRRLFGFSEMHHRSDTWDFELA